MGSAVATLAAAGCMYSFTAGSFPDYIETIAIIPFENETTRLELTQELHDVLLNDLPGSLGVREAGAELADAIVQGRIVSYQVTAPNYRPGATGDRAEVLQRQVAISVAVEIVDVAENTILWESAGVRAEGQYLETSETEEVGKVLALELLVQRIVDGAQSNW